MKNLIRRALGIKGPEPKPAQADWEKEYWQWVHSDFSPMEKEIIAKISPYSMTSKERTVNLIRAVEYLVNRKIDGDFVECGVWKGGSSMAMALTLNHLNALSRNIHLYDTFDGMSQPSAQDESIDGSSAEMQLKSESKEDSASVWCYSGLEEVKQNMQSTSYPEQNVHYIKGKVEDTIPRHIPDKIALLRLDTDWYESTKHELEHLYPRLVEGGILIIDDYGHWKGCRQAVDEYILAHDLPLFLIRVDYTARMAVKTYHGKN